MANARTGNHYVSSHVVRFLARLISAVNRLRSGEQKRAVTKVEQ